MESRQVLITNEDKVQASSKKFNVYFMKVFISLLLKERS